MTPSPNTDAQVARSDRASGSGDSLRDLCAAGNCIDADLKRRGDAEANALIT